MTDPTRPPISPPPLLARFQLQRPDFQLDVDLTLPGQGISAILGHSGSGKTTLLRAIAGLESSAQGYCHLGDLHWQDTPKGLFIPTYQRPLGYVFQEASLFNHLTVRGNLEFGQQRLPAAQRQEKRTPEGTPDLQEIAELLGINALLSRQPATLSGGERQRVAIARALLTAPRLLLMDEPLAALDLKRKLEILPYLEQLRERLSIPILYVSHSPDEVARLANHLVVLERGRVLASGPLIETLARTDLPQAFADDAGVVVETRVAAHEADELTRLDFSGGSIYVTRRPELPGQTLRCRIHARDVSIALEHPTGTSILNVFRGTVSSITPTGTPGQVLLRLELDGQVPLLARITERSRQTLQLQPGQKIWAQAKSVALLA